MITKELIKQEIDKLSDSLLQEAYALIKGLGKYTKRSHKVKITLRDMGGKLDNTDLRTSAYE